MKKLQVMLTVEVSLRMLNDMIITAIEGGSNYWYLLKEKATAQIQKYEGKFIPEIHDNKDTFFGAFAEAILPAVIGGEVIEIHDIEDPDGQPIGKLSWESIKKGIHEMSKNHPLVLALLINPESDFDAADADAIFQYIILGEIVYG